ncbi:MAG: hypothetical protein K2X44_12155 [Magnetospirillum sp.]|nr:hypothetical protein [Magnetospirillum sp.]
MDEIKLTGALPNMDVEITHRTAADGSAEHLTIHLVATPNFQSALPLVSGLVQLPFMLGSAQSPFAQSPFALWTEAMQTLMAPWAGMAHSNPWKANPWLAFLSDGFLGIDKK